PCTGSTASTSLAAVWNPILAGKVHQPYANFGPQLGLNFSPGNHKTSIRLSAGIFYESDVFNNTTNARTNVIKQGAFLDYKPLCSGGGAYSFHSPDGTTVSTTPDGTLLSDACNNESIGTAAPKLIAMQKAYQAATKAHATSPNSSYIGDTLAAGGAYGAPYRTPYSEQYSVGVQRELFKGAVLSVDYVHNATLKIAQTVDQNHIGAARFLNTTAAKNAVAATLAYCNAATVNAAIAPGGCAPSAVGSNPPPTPYAASIDDFASNGLDSGNEYLGGYPVSYATGDLTATPAVGAAFPGQNPLLGNGLFLMPIGKTAYDALEVVYRAQSSHPFYGLKSSNLQVAYTLSRILSTTGGTATSDSFFSSPSQDNDNPVAYMGRANLDHTNQFTFGGSATMKYGPRIGFSGHVFS